MSITVKNGEAKTVPFQVNDTSGDGVDVSSASSISFVVRDGYDSTDSTLISKELADFDVTDAATGLISCVLTETDLAYTAIPDGRYLSEIKIIFTASTDVDISSNIPFNVERSLYSR